MGISPPSDIVLDVVRAADPQSVRAARLALAEKAGGASFEALGYAPVRGAAPLDRSAGAGWARIPEAIRTEWSNNAALWSGRGAGRTEERGRVLAEFEAVTLATFVRSMLPRDAMAATGSGLAGDIFRSMLAETIAGEMAAAGGIGIADRLADRYGEPGAAAVADTRTAVTERQARRAGDRA